jgi:hypothetical protein
MRCLIALLIGVCICSIAAAQEAQEVSAEELNRRVQQLEEEVTELKQIVNLLRFRSDGTGTETSPHALGPWWRRKEGAW